MHLLVHCSSTVLSRSLGFCGFRCRHLQATAVAGHGSGSHSRLYPVAAGEGPAAGACGLAAAAAGRPGCVRLAVAACCLRLAVLAAACYLYMLISM